MTCLAHGLSEGVRLALAPYQGYMLARIDRVGKKSVIRDNCGDRLAQFGGERHAYDGSLVFDRRDTAPPIGARRSAPQPAAIGPHPDRPARARKHIQPTEEAGRTKAGPPG